MNTDTTSTKTLAVLYEWFSSETGLPTTLVSDNGPQFQSNDFKDKMSRWNIKHVFSPPYHPASNGAAERAVQLVKDRLYKMNVSARPVELHIALAYICKVHGLTPHSSTDRCPFELVKQGPLPSLFPSLTSDVSKHSELTTVRQSANRLRNRKNFGEGDQVIVYDNHKKLSYPAVVKEILGTNNYLVDSVNGVKHVSGDVMSKVTSSTAADDRILSSVNDDNNTEILSDTESVDSDLSEDLDDLYAPHIVSGGNVENVVRNRRTPRELADLGNASPRASRL